MKKIMVAVAALLCGAAMLFAQTSEVKTTTSGLIEDGAIDNLDFGTDIDDGLTFVQFNGDASYINFGWGKWLADSFWLSIYDSYFNNNGKLSDKASVDKTYGTKDGINVDFTDTDKTLSVGNGNWNFNNTFGLGLGFGNFGTQLVWRADWYERQGATIIDNGWNVTAGTTTNTSVETYDTPTGTKYVAKYDKIQNFERYNTFTVNFDGAGAKDLGDVEFYVELKKVYFGWNNTTRANNYTETTTVHGKDTDKVTASVKNIDNTFTPGLAFELGFNLPSGDVVQPKLVIANDFSMGLKAFNKAKTYTDVNDTLATTTTTVYEYSVKPGKYLGIYNTLTPKFVFDFDISEELTLTAQIAADIYVGNVKDGANTYKRTVTETTLTKATGDKYIDKDVWTNADNTDVNTLTTRVTPNYALGLVYQIKPGKVNLNFGVNVSRAPYQWVVTTETNSNINDTYTNETTDALGNKNGYKTVTVDQGGTESKEVAYTTENAWGGMYGTSTAFRIGATWFFTESVKLDAYYGNSFTNLVSGGNNFGIDLCVLF
ncbi:MAG: hypothetical protein J5687_05765 [Treponema sp.]|nr:hypothetical protein [Treponema sp.]